MQYGSGRFYSRCAGVRMVFRVGVRKRGGEGLRRDEGRRRQREIESTVQASMLRIQSTFDLRVDEPGVESTVLTLMLRIQSMYILCVDEPGVESIL